MVKFQYKGKSSEELEKLDVEEVQKILPSRQRRTLKRGFKYNQKRLMERIKNNPGKFVRTKNRDIIIIPEFFGVKIGIHNGKDYISIDVKPDMIGHRLGEFVPTRRAVKHSSPGFGATKSSKFIPLK
ncbi:MAG: 30S ribosomal protein S19 [Candidatus Aenigmatarchaeota archaeon]